MAQLVSPPQTEARGVIQEVFLERGEVCGQAACLWSERGPSQWPLVCGAFLLKQAQIQAAPASTPMRTDDGRFASGQAAWPLQRPRL